MAGFIVPDNEVLAIKLKMIQKSEAAKLSNFDCELALQGIKEIGSRMEKVQSNARIIAEWLSCHPKIQKVYYVGLPEHPGHIISKYQASGFGGVISIEVREPTLASHIVGKIQIITIADVHLDQSIRKKFPNI